MNAGSGAVRWMLCGALTAVADLRQLHSSRGRTALVVPGGLRLVAAVYRTG